MSGKRPPSSPAAPEPAPPAAPDIPREGGSFVVDKDGKVLRQEFTRHPDDPEHEDNVDAQRDAPANRPAPPAADEPF